MKIERWKDETTIIRRRAGDGGTPIVVNTEKKALEDHIIYIYELVYILYINLLAVS